MVRLRVNPPAETGAPTKEARAGRNGARASPAPPDVHLIESRQPGIAERVRELWHARRLIPYFARRFNQKRYMRTWLGRTWLILRPLAVVAGGALAFGGILGASAGAAPYFIAFLITYSAWHLFAESAYWAVRSLELNRGLMKRMYLPRAVILLASCTPAVIDFIVMTFFLATTLIAWVVVTGTFPLHIGPEVFLGFLGLGLLLAYGQVMGLLLSVPATQARDVRFGFRQLLHFWYLVTPVIYSLETVPSSYRSAIELNPLTAPVQLVRRGFLGDGVVPTVSVLVSVGGLCILGSLGAWIFFRSEAAALDHL